jgi:hypothetical protein
MSSAAAVYIESHKRLSEWNDELEFLGFVLLEIIDPEGFEERGFCWHQAADLPTIIDILQSACSIPNEKLGKVLNRKSLKYFKALLDQCRQIRNAVAHHQSPDKTRLKTLQERKENLSSWLQSIIRLVASVFDIHEVGGFAKVILADLLVIANLLSKLRLNGVLIPPSLKRK